MLKKLKSQPKIFFLAAFFMLCDLTSIAIANECIDDACKKQDWLKKIFKTRLHTSNIIVLGPPDNGKSTLINLLIHTSEYATRETQGNVLLDPNDQVDVLYHTDCFRDDVNKLIDPKKFNSEKDLEDLNGIPTIPVFMPVLGPISVKDFLGQRSGVSPDADQSSPENTLGSTTCPHAYESHAKVKSPVFQSTIIDAPGIGDKGRLAFFKKVIEKAPSDEINAFLLVVSAEVLANDDFGPDTFAYFKEIAQLLEKFDPTFTRVHLAVTHAGNEAFLKLAPGQTDARRIASERFKNATGMTVSTSKIFFFENKYNCLGETTIESLYKCSSKGVSADSSEDVSPDVQRAADHRQKNYQLNVLESFRLLHDVAKTNPLSRSEILNQIDEDHIKVIRSGQFGKSVEIDSKGKKSLGSISLPAGDWLIIGASNYAGSHDNAYYALYIASEEEDVTMAVNELTVSIDKASGNGSSTIALFVSINSPTTYHMMVNAQWVSANLGGIVGSLTAVRIDSL